MACYQLTLGLDQTQSHLIGSKCHWNKKAFRDGESTQLNPLVSLLGFDLTRNPK